MHSNLTQFVAQKFPDIPILPVFGNNDFMKNYQIPGCDVANIPVPTAADYFDALYKIWFEDIPSNLAGKTEAQISAIKDNFKHAGYYTYDFDEKITIIGLNTIIWAQANQCMNSGDEEWKEMNWLKDYLDS